MRPEFRSILLDQRGAAVILWSCFVVSIPIYIVIARRVLFDAPLDQAPSWPALHEVLRDRQRNVLFNHLGLREDEKGQIIKPDCADLLAILRDHAIACDIHCPPPRIEHKRGKADI